MVRFGSVRAPAVRPRRPTLAERARTTLTAAPDLDVFAGGVLTCVATHRVDLAGQVVLVVDEGSPLLSVFEGAGAPASVLVRAAHLYPPCGPDRVRARVELLGRLTVLCSATPGRRTLVVAPTHVSLDELVVSMRRYRRAAPDPLATVETDELERLGRRPQDLARMCALRAAEATADAKAILPVGLDRYGLTLRITDTRDTFEHRLRFPFDVDDPAALPRALRGLLSVPLPGP